MITFITGLSVGFLACYFLFARPANKLNEELAMQCKRAIEEAYEWKKLNEDLFLVNKTLCSSK